MDEVPVHSLNDLFMRHSRIEIAQKNGSVFVWCRTFQTLGNNSTPRNVNFALQKDHRATASNPIYLCFKKEVKSTLAQKIKTKFKWKTFKLENYLV